MMGLTEQNKMFIAIMIFLVVAIDYISTAEAIVSKSKSEVNNSNKY